MEKHIPKGRPTAKAAAAGGRGGSREGGRGGRGGRIIFPSTLAYQKQWGDEFKYGGAVEVDRPSREKGVVKTCKFPFTYKGEEYDDCTKVDSIAPWCATISYFDGEWWKPREDGQGTWGYCVPVEDRAYNKKKGSPDGDVKSLTIIKSKMPEGVALI